MKNPKERTALFEEISNSGALKAEYERYLLYIIINIYNVSNFIYVPLVCKKKEILYYYSIRGNQVKVKQAVCGLYPSECFKTYYTFEHYN